MQVKGTGIMVKYNPWTNERTTTVILKGNGKRSLIKKGRIDPNSDNEQSICTKPVPPATRIVNEGEKPGSLIKKGE